MQKAADNTPHSPITVRSQSQDNAVKPCICPEISSETKLRSMKYSDAPESRDVLHDRYGALADQRDGYRVGAHALARDAAGGVGGAEERRQALKHPSSTCSIARIDLPAYGQR